MWMPPMTWPISSCTLALQCPRLVRWNGKCACAAFRSGTLSWCKARRLHSPASIPQTLTQVGKEGDCAEERWLKGKLGTSEGWDGWRGGMMGLKEESWESDGEQSGQSGWEICPELFLSVSLSVSTRLRSHGAAPHHSASVVPLLSSLCSNITFIKMFWGFQFTATICRDAHTRSSQAYWERLQILHMTYNSCSPGWCHKYNKTLHSLTHSCC